MLKKLLFTFSFLLSFTLYSQTIYVDQSATGANNGTDWANAYTNLQTAIANIGSNTTINVAQGTYYPTATADRTISFTIPVGKKLFGGFPTGGGTRNPELYPTILSGDIGTIGDNTDNSYHVVFFSNSSPSNEFDGFIVENGYANGSGTDENTGGGIYVKNNSSSSYGVYIRDCIIRKNYASGNGGGIAINKRADIYNCKIYSNQATNGGGISNSTDGRINNSFIVNNLATDTGGGIDIGGFNNVPKAINCVIANNEAPNGAGGYLSRGHFINCTITNNNGTYALYYSIAGYVENNIIWGNEGNQISNTSILTNENNAVQGLTSSGTLIGLSANNTGSTNGIYYPKFTKPTSFTGNATNQTQLDEILNADWSINPESAAIDKGDNSKYPSSDSGTPSTDINNNNRTINSTIDLGAFESLTNINTNAATNQQPSSADLNGEVIFAETTSTVSRGFVYAATPNFDVTTATSVTNAATGLGVYTNNITGLTQDQLYYYRAWVNFDGVTYYGSEKQFKTNNLIAYYPFNGNANDESGNENNGTVYGATLTTDKSGNATSAYLFNGVDTDITCLLPGPIGTSPRTISFWAKTSETPHGTWDNAVISYGSNYNYGERFELSVNSQSRGLGIDINGAALTKDFDNLDNGWHYYAAVFDGGANKTMYDVKLYADGNLLTVTTYDNGNNTTTINTSSEKPIHIGNLFNTYRFFDGAIDEVKIYNKAFTDQEISDFYTQATLNVKTNNLDKINNFYISNNTLYFKKTQNLEDIKNIEVYNLLGQKVFNTVKIEKQIPILNLPKGMYILKVAAKNSSYNTLKFIIY
jgi:hypothetical protein